MDNENCTTAESKQIQAINKETVNKICSGQVIVNISIAMKELVENAIDASATIIDIHLKDYGSEFIEVSDNGCGIEKENFQNLTLKHFTSKIKKFGDLERLGTLGFRGEALSSLCSLCNVEVVTRHSSMDTGTKITYDANGKIIKEEIIPRQQGTSVTLKNIFSTLPVRRKQFIKNQKKEFVKLCNLLYAYCLLPSGIKYTCNHTTDKGTKTKIVSTNGQTSVRENIISLFSVKQLASVIDVNLVKPEGEVLTEFGVSLNPGEDLPFQMECLISSVMHGCGRSASDRQFYYINQRPCEPYKLMKLVNDIYKQFNLKQYPFVYLNIITKSCLLDVNITPDKRQVYLQNEKLLLAAVKSSLLEAFKDIPSTYKIQNANVTKQINNVCLEGRKGLKRNKTEGDVKVSSFMERFAKKHKSDESYSSQSTENIKYTDKGEQEDDEKLNSLIEIACKLTKGDSDDDDMKGKPNNRKLLDNLLDIKNIESNLERPDISINKDDTILDVTLDSSPNMADRRKVTIKMNINTIKEKLKRANLKKEVAENILVKFKSPLDPKENENAEDELQKHVSKSEFSQMEIVGQFNFGFVIVKLHDDLFVVDQHASDEKYNFEQLQCNTNIGTQKLVVPQFLELTASGKSIIVEHEDIFNKNGFYFKHDTDATEKFYLTSVPISHKVVFGKSDVDEMIFMLQESSNPNTCRPSRVRAMFASRACRKSIMIGEALSTSDMRRLINHMGEIEQPWNCPHGRPTMRHLINLKLIL